MTVYEDALLEGVREAAHLHSDLDSRQRLTTGAHVDVIGTIVALDIPLLFQPLDKLLGACVRVDEQAQGIMVTSERDLHMQRFTAAHELGHYLLGHEGSVDLDEDIGFLGRTKNKDPNEVAADSFAAEFLAPPWMIRHHCQRQSWSEHDLRGPDAVYQLSLRLGISYQATCWALQSNNVIDRQVADGLRRTQPKETKRAVLRSAPLSDSWADVWRVGMQDDGTSLLAGPHDVVAVEVEELAASGYEWSYASALTLGFSSLVDEYAPQEGSSVGAASWRRIVLSVPDYAEVTLNLVQKRPWEQAVQADLSVKVSTFGKETRGLPRRVRAPVAAND